MTAVGSGLPRVEGAAKVTGAARYAADVRLPGMLYGALVGAPVAAGRLRCVGTQEALAEPGVLRVLTRTDLPRFGALALPAAVLHMPLQDDEVRHHGEAVAIVLAQTLQAAEAAAALVRVQVERAAPLVCGHGALELPPTGSEGAQDFCSGDLDAGMREAALRVRREYWQPARHHNPIETCATLAHWSEGQLTLYDSVQCGYNVPPVIAAALGVPEQNVRVIAPHTGGGFGCKGYVWPHQILAAAAARAVDRPVRIALGRAQMYAMVGYQPWLRQRIELAARLDGRLTALRHRAVNSSARRDTHVELATDTSRGLYACPAIATEQRLERVHANLPTPMRAPVDGPGTWALESAMDELAVTLGVDPLKLRLANHADVEPASGRPWSSKQLREAYAQGAQRYGWCERRERPRRDGDWWIGHGMASCTMGSFRFPAAARVRLRADGSAVVETGTHDIGTGTQTVLAQIAADALGVEPGRVRIRWGDTRLPRAGPVYGSSATLGTGSAVLLAARDALAQLEKRVAAPGPDFAKALRRAGLEELCGEGRFALPGDAPFDGSGGSSPHAMRSWGAIFVEVGVDRELGLLRLRRAVGSYSAGRIINPRLARSQAIGGIIWEWGKATLEESAQEPSHGCWLARNLSNVSIPVNADIPADIDVHFVDEFDPHASAIGARGLGELTATGVAAAVANAVFDAVGARVRSLPIRPWKILEVIAP